MTSPPSIRKPSIRNYDKLTRRDFRNIFKAFKDKDNRTRRLEIMRFLAQEAREEKAAKTYDQILDHMNIRLKAKITLQAVRKHCKILTDMGIIYQTRSKSHEPSSRGGDYIKFYLVVQNLIAILAILNAGMLGLDKEAAKRIKKGLTREFNANPNNQFRYGIYASGLSYLQAPAFDTLRNIVHNYIQLQKDIVNSWSAVAEEFNTGYYYYYYPWFYPAASFANMASKAYRSIADYAISGLNIAQNNFDASIDMSKTYSKLVDDNITELSRMALNYSKIFKPMPRASISTEGGPETTSTITSIPPPDMEDDEEEYDLSELRKLIDELTEIKQIALSSA
jgi:hypothetical protein